MKRNSDPPQEIPWLSRQLLRFLSEEQRRRWFDPYHHELKAARVASDRWTTRVAVAFKMTSASLHCLWLAFRSRTPSNAAASGAAGRGWGESLLQDLKCALRGFRRDPRFSLAAILILALGMGANTAAFSFVSGLLLRPLPFESPQRLAVLWSSRESADVSQGGLSYPDYQDLKARNRTLRDVALYGPWGFTLRTSEGSRHIPALITTPNLFSVLGVSPLLGRGFQPEDGLSGAEPVVVLSHGIWRSHYGGREDLVGRIIEVDDERRQVVGVMPPGFRFTDDSVGFWLPMAPRDDSRQSRWLHAVARLQPGIELDQADRELQAIASALAGQYPDSNAGWSILLESLPSAFLGDVPGTLWTIQAVTLVVLLITCLNLAGLLTARTENRKPEFELRGMLGADRFRLLRLVLAEGLLLSLCGAVAALGLAAAALVWMKGLLPQETAVRDFENLAGKAFERLDQVGVDGWMLLFTLGSALLTTLVFSLVPALRAGRPAFQSTRLAGRGGTSASRKALIAAEVAASMLLLVAAGLLVRSFQARLSVDPGIDPDRLMKLDLSLGSLRQAQQRIQFATSLVDELSTLPEIQSLAYATTPPFNGVSWTTEFTYLGETREAVYNAIAPEYLRTVGIPLVAGREFTPLDDASHPPVALINQEAARRYWPGQDPLGQAIQIRGSGPQTQIVGIVADARQERLEREAQPELLVPFRQRPAFFLRLLVRCSGDPVEAVSLIRTRINGIDPDIPVENPATMRALIDGSYSKERFSTVLASLFAGLSLAIALAGVHGVVSYLVAQRRYELGVRMALGASRRQIRGIVLGWGSKPALFGLLVGGFLAALLAQRMTPLLFQTSPLDPRTFVATAFILLTAVFLSCWHPARAASRVDPAQTLRAQ